MIAALALSGCQWQAGEEVSLRKFPYPYVAGVALTGEIGRAETPEEFLEIARFLNSEGETSMGPGLGLEVGAGFRLHAAADAPGLVLIEDTTLEPTDAARIVEDFIRAGLIDRVHVDARTDASERDREARRTAVAYLRERGLEVAVLDDESVRRGGGRFGATSHALAGRPEAGGYARELLRSCGVRFVDTREFVHTIGQGAMCSLIDRFEQLFDSLRYGLTAGDWRARSIFSNRLIEPCVAEEGAGLYSFKTFSGAWGPVGRRATPDLAQQLAEPVLFELEAKGGTMIVDTCLADDDRWPHAVAPATAEALERLAQRHRDGRLYVATTERLLTHNLVHRYLDWTVERDTVSVDIRIRGVNGGAGDYWIPTLDELQGLTFYTPAPGSTRVYVGAHEIEGLVRNPADDTGRTSVTIPRTHLRIPPEYGI